jgi:hypothetical protein
MALFIAFQTMSDALKPMIEIKAVRFTKRAGTPPVGAFETRRLGQKDEPPMLYEAKAEACRRIPLPRGIAPTLPRQISVRRALAHRPRLTAAAAMAQSENR